MSLGRGAPNSAKGHRNNSALSGGPRQDKPRARGRGFRQKANVEVSRGDPTVLRKATSSQIFGNPSGNGSTRTASAPSAGQGDAVDEYEDQEAFSNRYDRLKRARSQERKDMIRQGKIADPEKPRSLKDAITLVGTCREMCAEFERVERAVRNEVDDAEKSAGAVDESKMVKVFKRSAAGDEEQLPSDLRPPNVLDQTCDYLFHSVIGDATSLAKVHGFVWNRTRAIRRDFSIQQLKKPADLRIAITCYERIARFHILSLHELALAEKPYPEYDYQQDREQLDKTLVSLMQYYDDSRGRVALSNECEFRAYYILFQLRAQTPELEDRIQSWPLDIASDARVQKAWQLYSVACNTADPKGPLRPHATQLHPQQDWHSFWQLVGSNAISFLMGCLAEIFFFPIRHQALDCIARSTRRARIGSVGLDRNCIWQLAEFMQLFGFDQDEDLARFLEPYGLSIENDDNGQQTVNVSAIAGAPLDNIVRQPGHLKTSLVEEKRHGRTFPAIIDGMTVRQAQVVGRIETYDENDNLMFVPDQHDSGTSFPSFDGSGFTSSTSAQTAESPAHTTATASASMQAEPARISSFGGFSVTGADKGLAAISPLPKANLNAIHSFGSASGSAGFTESRDSGSTTRLSDGSFAAPARGLEPAPSLLRDTQGSRSGALSHSIAPDSNANFFGRQSKHQPKPDFAAALAAAKAREGSKANGANTQSFSDIPVTMPATAVSLTVPDSHGASGPFQSLRSPNASNTGRSSGLSGPSEYQRDSNGSNAFATPTSNLPTFAHNQTPKVSETSSQMPVNGALRSSGSDPPPASSAAGFLAPSQEQQIASSARPTSQASLPAQAGKPIGLDEQKLRRPSVGSKPKVPSPLSNSFSASDGNTPRNDLKSKPTPTDEVASLDLLVSRVAKELTYDRHFGIISQYVQWVLNQEIPKIQERVSRERSEKLADDYRESYLERKWAKRWRETCRRIRRSRQGMEMRSRRRRRLEECDKMGGFEEARVADDATVLEKNTTTPLATHKEPTNKQLERNAASRLDANGNGISEERLAPSGTARRRSLRDNHDARFSHGTPDRKRMKTNEHSPGRNRASTATHDRSTAAFLAYTPTRDVVSRGTTTHSPYFLLKGRGIDPDSVLFSPRGTKRTRNDMVANDSSPIPRDAHGRLAPGPSSARVDRNPAASSMEHQSVTVHESRPSNVDEDVIERMKRVREGLREDHTFRWSNVEECLPVRSLGDSPSMALARSEARTRAPRAESKPHALGHSCDVPAYRLRENRFQSRQDAVSRAISRAKGVLESRSSSSSRSVSRASQCINDSPGSPVPNSTRLSAHSKQLPSLEPNTVLGSKLDHSTNHKGIAKNARRSSGAPDDLSSLQHVQDLSPGSDIVTNSWRVGESLTQDRLVRGESYHFPGPEANHDWDLTITEQDASFQSRSQSSQSHLEQAFVDDQAGQQTSAHDISVDASHEPSLDHTVPKERIPNALSRSFGSASQSRTSPRAVSRDAAVLNARHDQRTAEVNDFWALHERQAVNGTPTSESANHIYADRNPFEALADPEVSDHGVTDEQDISGEEDARDSASSGEEGSNRFEDYTQQDDHENQTYTHAKYSQKEGYSDQEGYTVEYDDTREDYSEGEDDSDEEDYSNDDEESHQSASDGGPGINLPPPNTALQAVGNTADDAIDLDSD